MLRLNLGLTVVSPAEHDEANGFDPVNGSEDDLNLFEVMKWDLQQVLESDAVVVLPNWESSSGVAHELAVARAVGIPILQYPDLKELNDHPLTTNEVRVVNPQTGGAKGQKLQRFDLIPSDALWALAEHFGKGAHKYSERNWERGTDWSLNFAAAQRHLWQWWDGEDIDEESGSSHLIAVAWHALALFHFATTHPELDDRPGSTSGAK